MQKYIFSVVGVGLAFFLAVSVGEAANTTSRFRGSSWEDFVKYRDTIRAKTQYKSYRQLSSRQNTIAQPRGGTSTTSQTGADRRTTSRLIFAPSAGRTVQAVQDTTRSQIFTASSGVFSITLPSNFVVALDTLKIDSGQMELKYGTTNVEIFTTNERCEGGFAFLRSCLQEKSDAYLNLFKTDLPEQLSLAENKLVYLDSSKTRFDKTNIAWFSELTSVQGVQAGQLVFAEPTQENIWVMRILETGGEEVVLSDQRVLNQMFASLFKKQSSSTSNIRSRLASLFSNRRSTGGTTKETGSKIVLGESTDVTFRAHNVPFEFTVPKGFELIEDSLEWSAGTMLLEKEGESIKVLATETICDTDVPTHKRFCMETEAGKLGQELKDQFPEALILQEENMLLQLSDVAITGKNINRSASTKNDIVRILTLRNDGRRIVYITLVEPQNGFVWTILVESSEDLDSLLVNSREKTSFFESIFFDLASIVE